MKSLCLILVLALSATPACSRFSSSSRQQRAYAKYIRKSKSAQEKRQAQFRQERAKIPQPDMMPSEPRETVQTSDGPQAVPSDPESQ